MIRILSMTAADAPQVAALERDCFSTPWSERSIAAELGNELSLWLVALDGQTVAGYVGSQTVLPEADMMNLAVKPDYRRQGIASALVVELINRLSARGAESLTLEVRASNKAARALYASLGFREIGTRRGYYFAPREDALIFRKEWRN